MKHYAKKLLALLIAAVLTATALLPGSVFAKDAENANYVEGEVIAVLNESAGNRYMKAASVRDAYGYGYAQKGSFTFGGNTRAVVLRAANLSTEQMLKQLKNNPAVKYALPNFKKHISDITNDAYSKYQWSLDNTGQNYGTAGLDTNADALWEDAAKSEKEQVIAVVDTGIDDQNEELKDVLWNNPYGTRLLGKHGRDFSETIASGEPTDDNGHGTHCAGIIAAAANNGKGVSGINQSHVKIMALKFLDEDGGGATAGALAAFDYIQRAVKLGTNVVAINNSWGGMGSVEEQTLYDSIFNELGALGVITFAAAGNEASELGESEEPYDEPMLDVPACCNSPYCITVAASNENDGLASFSNYSKEYVDIASPGTDILSTVSYDCFNPTVYTAEQKNALCAYLQEYETAVNEGDFGYFKSAPLDAEEYPVGTNYGRAVANGFGLGGKATQLKFTDEPEEEEYFKMYAFEVPFTVPNENADYSFSAMFKCDNACECSVYDVPATFTASKALQSADMIAYEWGTDTADFWKHFCFDHSTKNEFEAYKKGKERKLIFIFGVYKQNTTVTFDDLAISVQNVNTADFGKYDFYNGTSMATPHATGAAALIKNARPDASTLDIVNMIKNTGRYSAALEGKTEVPRVLSLDAVDSLPPLIADVDYNKDNNIEITGSFRNVTGVSVNGEAAEVVTSENGKIIIKDKSYSTKKITVKVENAVGSDEYNTFVSNKPGFNLTKMEMKPEVYGAFAIPAGSNAYFVNTSGGVGAVSYDKYSDMYSYYEYGIADATKIFDNEMYSVTGAAWRDGCIYMTLLDMILSPSTGVTLGYETALVKYDPMTNKTVKICALPDESTSGASLANYNGELYLIGGLDFTDTMAPSTAVYKLDEKAKAFKKQAASLPEGRASAKFLQYKDKLVGMYGSNKAGTFPSILVFDGTSWSAKQTALESDDVPYPITFEDGTSLMYYEGNLGYGKNGILANGSFVYGVGDTFTYNPDTDKITPHKCSARNSLAEPSLVGTTVPGSFIGFQTQGFIDIDDDISVGSLVRIAGEAYDDIANIDFPDDPFDFATEEAYYINLKNTGSYATLDANDIAHGYLTNAVDTVVNYGDRLTLHIKSEPGYAVTAIKNNGKNLSTKSDTATLVIRDAVNIVNSTATLVASPINSLKVSKTTAGTFTLKWNKAKKGTGYKVQQYKDNKWQTVKTIKDTSTVTYRVKAVAGETKFRVRAYGTYNGKTVYGAAKSKTVCVPKQETVKTLSGTWGAFTVKYHKNAKASGYEIQYAKAKSFKGAKTVTVKKNSTTSQKIYASKGKYYVRVRAYKLTNGKRVYGAYSDAKSVRVK